MCTLSVFFDEKDGYRIFMNRDERHDRTPEKPPQIIDSAHGIFGPIDPQGGGTWIAYNNRGYWACLLNGYFDEDKPKLENPRSRGHIILELLRQSDPLRAAADINPSPYNSFRLVVGSKDTHSLYVWDRERYSAQPFQEEGKGISFLTSSSWQQDNVIEIRKELFREWIRTPKFAKNSIPSFHYSKEPEERASIMMYRDHSRTQSVVGMLIRSNKTDMIYDRIKA
ncbi:MAG: hypothetical protein GC137_03505 [Alphaproteobacteria bacterium]|nr:hypothetical protein [Alphaproteobacteria bacterium]